MANIINRELEIRFPNGDRDTITSSNIVAESMIITKSICDGNLKLGGCIATQFDLQLIDIAPNTVQGKKIQAVLIEYSDQTRNILHPREDLIPSDELILSVYLTDNCSERIMFTGYIDMAKRQKNREIVSITAYDEFYKMSNQNVYTWFGNFAYRSGDSKISTLLNSLFSAEIGYDEKGRPEGLSWKKNMRWRKSADNDNYNRRLSLSLDIAKAVYKESITALDVLRSANELMGLFGCIETNGLYYTVDLTEQKEIVIDSWIDLDFEEYTTSQIDIVSFAYNDNNVCTFGRTSATGNCYYSGDNILTICSDNHDTVNTLVDNVMNRGQLGRVSTYGYRPFKLVTADELIAGKNIKLGSKLQIQTGYRDIKCIEGFVFQEKITGIQSLKYEFSAEGDEILSSYDR